MQNDHTESEKRLALNRDEFFSMLCRTAFRDYDAHCEDPAQYGGFMLNLPIAPVTYSPERFNATPHMFALIRDHLGGITRTPVNVYLPDALLIATYKKQ